MTERVVARYIAGDVLLAERPGEAVRRWRLAFGLTQAELAKRLGITASIISDYESGRRSPGARFVKRFVDAIIAVDLERGGGMINAIRRQFCV